MEGEAVIEASQDPRYVQLSAGIPRGGADEFKRYLVHDITFDSRAHMLDELGSDWAPEVIEQGIANRERVIAELIFEHGLQDWGDKVRNFKELGPQPFYVIGPYAAHLKEVRSAFVCGHYYVALVGAATLGERVLTQVVRAVRDEARPRAAKSIYKTNASSDWAVLAQALLTWELIDQGTHDTFMALKDLRNNAVHYNKPELDQESGRDDALRAIELIQEALRGIYNAHLHDAYIPRDNGGWSWIRRVAEDDVFVRTFLIPRSTLVSPGYRFASPDHRSLALYDLVEWDGPETLTDIEFKAEASNRGAV